MSFLDALLVLIFISLLAMLFCVKKAAYHSEKVYCKNCARLYDENICYIDAETYFSPTAEVWANPRSLNRNNHCNHYRAKEAQ